MKHDLHLILFRSGQMRKTSLAVSIICVTMGLLIALASGVGSDRTLIIEAETRWVGIEFSGDTDAWPIGEAYICTARPERALSLARGDGPCDERLFEITQSQSGFVEWGRGGATEVTSGVDGGLIIRVIRSNSHPDGTLILVDREIWRTIGALSWFGYVTVGKTAESGERGLLLSGQFEIRELFKWFWPSLRGTEVVKSGVLRQGEAVSLIDAGRPQREASQTTMQSFGHIYFADSNDAFRVVGLTSVGKPALSIRFLGADKPAVIRPNWIDRVTSSPMLAALITIFAILISVTKFVTAWLFPRAMHVDDK